nr:hypothetical protein [Tanacetum cinerariifolium]
MSLATTRRYTPHCHRRRCPPSTPLPPRPQPTATSPHCRHPQPTTVTTLAATPPPPSTTPLPPATPPKPPPPRQQPKQQKGCLFTVVNSQGGVFVAGQQQQIKGGVCLGWSAAEARGGGFGYCSQQQEVFGCCEQ